MATQSVRLSESTISAARKEAGVMSRTLQAQIEHWVRLGQAIEQAPTFDDKKIKSALRGEISPDELGSYERAVYDVEHEVLMENASDTEVEFFRQLGKRQREAGFAKGDLGT
ncbi:TA system antitoxin ParD family protein [Salinisphaera orenii]|uniref:TA system antitoxin ParD family protein n=1 Tax=Salinisphaera orenii TaxID=856731 RepID=UPI0013A614F5